MMGNIKRDLSSFIVGQHSIHNRVGLPAAGCMGGLEAYRRHPIESVIVGKQDRWSNNEKSSIATISSLLHLRRRDWQEAFRSMFHCWESKLKCLSPSAAFAAMTCDSNIILSVDASLQACRTECESLPKTPRIPTVIPRHTRPPMPSGRRTHSSSCRP